MEETIQGMPITVRGRSPGDSEILQKGICPLVVQWAACHIGYSDCVTGPNRYPIIASRWFSVEPVSNQ